MVKEIRKIASKSRANYIRSLQYRNLLPVHFSEAGYVCYDTDELKAYLKVMRKGRPPKVKETK